MLRGKEIPISNFLLSISTPMIREAPAVFAPSATYENYVSLGWYLIMH